MIHYDTPKTHGTLYPVTINRENLSASTDPRLDISGRLQDYRETDDVYNKVRTSGTASL